MRKVIDLQMEFWKKDISKIEFDLKSRDEIPKVLIGLQHIYSTPLIREQVFQILKRIVPDKSHINGRPGMDLWKILVLGTLRLNCNWDYDKVHEMANNHKTIRQMLGHNELDFLYNYPLQTIKDNVVLLTPDVLDEINQIIVKAAHSLISPKKEIELKGSCDSFVVETNVHFPTDINLLYDSIRRMIILIAMICSALGITDWRQYQHNIRTVKRMVRSIQSLKRSTSKDKSKKKKQDELILNEYGNYLNICIGFIVKAKNTILNLRKIGILSESQKSKLNKVEYYIKHAERQIDQTYRRIFCGEKIPHKEKVLSIFETHTEWISKGKAGVPQELGLKVCVLKDQYGLILHHKVMERQTDDKVTVPMIKETKEKFENLSNCSFDKGFYTFRNKNELEKILDNVILPKKGKLSKKDKEIEHSDEFIRYRRKHSAVESSINALENHGLDRCPDHAIDGFKRYIALAVLARNIQILGHHIQQKKLKQERRRKAA